MNQDKYLLALHRGLNLTLPRYQKLKTAFLGDWEACVQGNLRDWQLAGIDKKGIEKWFANQKGICPNQEQDLINKCEAKVLVHGTDDYPIALQHTPSPPALLLVRGQILDEDWPSLAVVGSRRVSPYGRRALEKIATPIAQSGMTIVSGLAYGVDTLAHETALKYNTRTIAVLGSGIDAIYPMTNELLGQKIIKNGAVISEFLPNTKARPEYFPMRNRIIAGLSQGTLVIEAAEKSGSLITARYANDFGREVFAVPGEIFTLQAQGTNQLIADGAQPALSGGIILKSMGLPTGQPKKTIKLPTQGIEAEIIKVLPPNEALHIDDITRLSGFPGTTISANLLLLEIRGWVRNMGHQMYVRNV